MAENIKEAYHVNLGGDSVPDASRRNRIYQYMILYLVVCGILMIEGGYRVAVGYLDVTGARRELAGIKQDFMASHPGETDLQEYAAVLKSKLDADSATISAIEKNLPISVPAMQLIYELMDSAPSNSVLTSFAMLSENEGVTWKCRIVQTVEEQMSPDELVKKWRNSEKIQQYVSNVMMMNLEDGLFVSGQPAMTISCRARLKAGKN